MMLLRAMADGLWEAMWDYKVKRHRENVQIVKIILERRLLGKLMGRNLFWNKWENQERKGDNY